jgi:hypothetical protein
MQMAMTVICSEVHYPHWHAVCGEKYWSVDTNKGFNACLPADAADHAQGVGGWVGG